MNMFILSGRLGSDPEVKYSKGGMALLTISVAESASEKQGDTWEKVTNWHDLKLFGKQAETVAKFFKKGDYFSATGRVKPGSYQKDDGQKKYFKDFIVEKFDMNTERKKSDGDSGAPKRSSKMDDDELPF